MRGPSEGTEAPRGGKRATLSWRERLQAIRHIPEERPILIRWLLVGMVFLAALSLLPRPGLYRRIAYNEGTIQPTAVIAEFDFYVKKDPDLLEQERIAARESVPPVLVREDSIRVASLARLEALQLSYAAVRQSQIVPPDESDARVELTQNTVLALLTLDADEIFSRTHTLLNEAFERGILGQATADLLAGSEQAALHSGGVGWVGPMRRFIVGPQIAQELRLDTSRGAEDLAVAELVKTFAWPNITYDRAATLARRQLVWDGVTEHTELVLNGEKIIGAHERITPEKARRLSSYEDVREERGAHMALSKRLLGVLGRVLLITFMLTGFILYLRAYCEEIVANLSDGFLLALTFSGFLLLAGLTLNGLQISGYLIPVAGFSVMVALLYDERLALVATGFLTGIIGLITNQGLTFIVVIGFGSVAAILSVHQLRDRRQLYRLLLYVPMTHLAALGAMGLVTSMEFEEALGQALYLVANPFIATGFALFAVPMSESLFGRCTNLTLLELLDLNRPLLRRLMIETPGTYHHSLMVGTLAEAGASAIGANPLRARVLGYYHDIGKIRKPEYFIENQMAGRKNPHDKLAPTMSRLILESHVRDGLALAVENKLPRVVRDAIAQHHGTSLMTYFYHRAKQKDASVSDSEYRYPGPRPRTRELGIVLLADQIDAASRSLEEPTPSRLRGLIKTARGNHPRLISSIYLNTLSRHPTQDELASAEEYFQTSRLAVNQASIDLAWALINTKEFLYRH